MLQLMLVVLAIAAGMQESRTPEATSLLGKPLFAPAMSLERSFPLQAVALPLRTAMLGPL